MGLSAEKGNRSRSLRRGRRHALALGLAAVALFVFVAGTGASADSTRLGELIVSIEGSLSPTKLPKKTPAPITLNVEGSVKDADGTRPSPLNTLALEFDKHGHIYTKGLPTCKPGQIESTQTSTAKKTCGKALVGTGKVTAEIELPEQAPFSASGPLLIFNGVPKGGKPVLVFHVYARVPAPTAFVTTGVIGKAHGKFGTSTLIQIPTIVAGYGSLTSFKAKIHKTWTYKHEKRSLLLASCPSGHLYAHGEFNFVNGDSLSGNIVKSCTPAK